LSGLSPERNHFIGSVTVLGRSARYDFWGDAQIRSFIAKKADEWFDLPNEWNEQKNLCTSSDRMFK
jgi:hypothetical protein